MQKYQGSGSVVFVVALLKASVHLEEGFTEGRGDFTGGNISAARGVAQHNNLCATSGRTFTWKLQNKGFRKVAEEAAGTGGRLCMSVK